MTEVIHERSPRSRGRVRCDDCGRRIPKGEQCTQLMAFDDGTVREWRRCQPCEAVAGYVARWRGPYSEDCYPDDFYDWAHESTAACAAADADPAQAWDDEAWAAFAWRMQTSPVINARRK